MFHISCDDCCAAEGCADVQCQPSLVCVVYYFAHSAVAPAVVDEGNNTSSFTFDIAFGGYDLVWEIVKLCVYIGGCDGVSGA